MNRRKFIKTMLIGAGACVVPGVAISRIKSDTRTYSNGVNNETSGIAIRLRQEKALKVYEGILDKIYKENIETFCKIRAEEMLGIIPETYNTNKTMRII